jgi:hypothetical protein
LSLTERTEYTEKGKNNKGGVPPHGAKWKALSRAPVPSAGATGQAKTPRRKEVQKQMLSAALKNQGQQSGDYSSLELMETYEVSKCP